MKSEDALKRFSSSRQALFEAIAGLSDAELTGPKVEGVWTIKDLLGHISAWEQKLLVPLASFAIGGTFKAEVVYNHDAWNLNQSTRRSSWTCAEIIKEIETTRQEVLDLLNKLSANQWGQSILTPWGEENTIAEMISGLAWHEEEHTKSILKYRSQ